MRIGAGVGVGSCCGPIMYGRGPVGLVSKGARDGACCMTDMLGSGLDVSSEVYVSFYPSLDDCVIQIAFSQMSTARLKRVAVHYVADESGL